jgi:hypothetical protein
MNKIDFKFSPFMMLEVHGRLLEMSLRSIMALAEFCPTLNL